MRSETRACEHARFHGIFILVAWFAWLPGCLVAWFALLNGQTGAREAMRRRGRGLGLYLHMHDAGVCYVRMNCSAFASKLRSPGRASSRPLSDTPNHRPSAAAYCSTE